MEIFNGNNNLHLHSSTWETKHSQKWMDYINDNNGRMEIWTSVQQDSHPKVYP